MIKYSNRVICILYQILTSRFQHPPNDQLELFEYDHHQTNEHFHESIQQLIVDPKGHSYLFIDRKTVVSFRGLKRSWILFSFIEKHGICYLNKIFLLNFRSRSFFSIRQFHVQFRIVENDFRDTRCLYLNY